MDPEEDSETDDALVAFFTQHVSETRPRAKPFQPIGYIHEETPAEAESNSSASASAVRFFGTSVPSCRRACFSPALKETSTPEVEKRGKFW